MHGNIGATKKERLYAKTWTVHTETYVQQAVHGIFVGGV